MQSRSQFSDDTRRGGAKNLGMFAVWINRAGDEQEGIEPDAEIRTLDELSKLL